MENEKSLRQQIIDLGVEESLAVSLDTFGLATVRSYAYQLGLDLDRRYSTLTDSVSRVITLTRTK